MWSSSVCEHDFLGDNLNHVGSTRAYESLCFQCSKSFAGSISAPRVKLSSWVRLWHSIIIWLESLGEWEIVSPCCWWWTLSLWLRIGIAQVWKESCWEWDRVILLAEVGNLLLNACFVVLRAKKDYQHLLGFCWLSEFVKMIALFGICWCCLLP